MIAISIYLLIGFKSLDYQQMADLFSQTSTILSSLKYRIRLDKITVSEKSLGPCYKMSAFTNDFCIQHLVQTIPIPKKKITLFVLPPLQGSNGLYVAGKAYGRSFLRNMPVALAHCGFKGRDSDVEACSKIAAHEILHTLGARHIARIPNLMHPDLGSISTDILKITKRQVYHYIQSVKRGLAHVK